MIPAQAQMLRMYVRGGDRVARRPLHEVIVETARRLGLAGASVFPIELAYGHGHHWHDASSEYIANDPPMVIEIVDAPERIATLLEAVGSFSGHGLITVHPVRVIHYRHEDTRNAS